MYQTAEEIMKQDVLAIPAMPPVTNVQPAHSLMLPTIQTDDVSNELPRISKETMIQVLDGAYDHCYRQRAIVDCRFEYEFEGGHIAGASNYNDKETLASQLFDVEPTLWSECGSQNMPSLIIFHCEYSAHRAPLMAKHIRNKDRAVNAEHYPALTYPEMYILDGGYSSFFKDHRARCDPQNYVEMDAKEHAAACERGMGKVKHAQRSKLVRAQTFAFGQHTQLDSSPTAMGRSRIDDDVDMDLCLNYTPARPDLRKHGQRMLSFPG
jgi:M-phase inducer tyrosine phosphatase